MAISEEVPATNSPSLSSDQGHNLQSVKKLCIDEMLQRHCGELEKWQLRHFVLTTLAWTLNAFHSLVMVFADYRPHWRCLTDTTGEACHVSTAGGGSSVCALHAGSWEWVGGCGGATVSEWGLICGDKFKVGLVQALFFGGCILKYHSRVHFAISHAL